VDVPLEKSGQDGLGISAGTKTMTALLQISTQFQVIIYFAVEGDNGIAAFGSDGLVARGEIDNFEPCRSEGD